MCFKACFCKSLRKCWQDARFYTRFLQTLALTDFKMGIYFVHFRGSSLFFHPCYKSSPNTWPGSAGPAGESQPQPCGSARSGLPCIRLQPLASLIIPRVGEVCLTDKSKQLCNKSQQQMNFQGRTSLGKFIAFSVINKVTHSTFHLDEKFKISEGKIILPAEES